MAIIYPEFGDLCEVSAEILGVTPEQIERLPNVGLASSALAAPQAGFGDTDVYPTLLEKAAVLLDAWYGIIRCLTATSARPSS